MIDIRNIEQDQVDSPGIILVPTDNKSKFRLGALYMTPGVQSEIDNVELSVALGLHVSGDWGDVDVEDWRENDESLKRGFRLLSVYHSADGIKFWIITERDRSSTTVLLPSEY